MISSSKKNVLKQNLATMVVTPPQTNLSVSISRHVPKDQTPAVNFAVKQMCVRIYTHKVGIFVFWVKFQDESKICSNLYR